MRKTALAILTLLLFVACRQNKRIESAKFNELSRFYKDTSFSEMFVYPDTAYIDSLFFFRGNLIDSSAFKLLPENITYGPPWTEGFYGVYSFKLNEQFTGLLTRTPGEYSPTAISLWIYDREKDSISNNIQLADIFGDAGDAQIINSYLFFDKEQLKALIYRHTLYYRSVEDESDTTVDENHYYNLANINFTSVDTLMTDSLKLHQAFRNQLIKMSRY